ncbi:hypothetical protein PC120_g23963 [Phytophthora cactorum]|nr:hypothetical protein PC120_g23963 [Phytophthora cactorum]
MAEAPPDQKRKLDEPPGARKRRRVRSSVEGASAETARSLGGVAAVKDVCVCGGGGIGEGRLDFQAAIQQLFGLALQVYSAWGKARWRREG